MKFCVRCDQPIRPGEPYDTHIHHGATLAGCTNHSHQTCPGTSTSKEPGTTPSAK